MTLREKILKIVCREKYNGQCNENLKEEVNRKAIDAILSAIEESLPRYKSLEEFIGSAYGYEAGKFDGYNECLAKIKAMLNKKG